MHGNGKTQAGPATPAAAQGPVYEIRLRGQLGPGWAAWFAGLAVTLDDHGDTLLTGPLPDQAALFGVLKRVRDAGLPLLALNCLAGAYPPDACPPGQCVTDECGTDECLANRPGATGQANEHEEQTNHEC